MWKKRSAWKRDLVYMTFPTLSSGASGCGQTGNWCMSNAYIYSDLISSRIWYPKKSTVRISQKRNDSLIIRYFMNTVFDLFAQWARWYALRWWCMVSESSKNIPSLRSDHVWKSLASWYLYSDEHTSIWSIFWWE